MLFPLKFYQFMQFFPYKPHYTYLSDISNANILQFFMTLDEH